MDLSLVLESSGLGHLRELLVEDEEFDLESFKMLTVADIDAIPVEAIDKSHLLALVNQLAADPLPASSSPEKKSLGSADVNSGSVTKMMDMGLSREVSDAALRQCDGDLTRAINLAFDVGDGLLLSGPTPEEPAPPLSPTMEDPTRSARSDLQDSAVGSHSPEPGIAPAEPRVWARLAAAAAPPPSSLPRQGGAVSLSPASPPWQPRMPATSSSSSWASHEASVSSFVSFCGLGLGRPPAPSSPGSSRLDSGNRVGRGAVVVILRGLPGAGKSTLTSRLRAAAEADGRRVVICSADKYFEDAAGRYHFDPRRLKDAHASCRTCFLAALHSSVPTKAHAQTSSHVFAHARADQADQVSQGVVEEGQGVSPGGSNGSGGGAGVEESLPEAGPLIVVDNTNTMCWEYAEYLKLAAAQQGRGGVEGIHVVEVTLPIPRYNGGGGKGKGGKGLGPQGKGHHHHHSPLPPESVSALQVCASRNQHGVPFENIVQMFCRWEHDPASTKIPAGGF